MKFAKVLRSKLVQEWRKKYIDYDDLKILLKLVERSKIIEKQEEIEIVQTCESLDTNRFPTRYPNEVSITISQQAATAVGKNTRRSSTTSISGLASKSNNLIRKMSKKISNAIHERPSFPSPPRSKSLFYL